MFEVAVLLQKLQLSYMGRKFLFNVGIKLSRFFAKFYQCLSIIASNLQQINISSRSTFEKHINKFMLPSYDLGERNLLMHVFVNTEQHELKKLPPFLNTSRHRMGTTTAKRPKMVMSSSGVPVGVPLLYDEPFELTVVLKTNDSTS